MVGLQHAYLFVRPRCDFSVAVFFSYLYTLTYLDARRHLQDNNCHRERAHKIMFNK